jgi:hypothetical protein
MLSAPSRAVAPRRSSVFRPEQGIKPVPCRRQQSLEDAGTKPIVVGVQKQRVHGGAEQGADRFVTKGLFLV